MRGATSGSKTRTYDAGLRRRRVRRGPGDRDRTVSPREPSWPRARAHKPPLDDERLRSHWAIEPSIPASPSAPDRGPAQHVRRPARTAAAGASPGRHALNTRCRWTARRSPTHPGVACPQQRTALAAKPDPAQPHHAPNRRRSAVASAHVSRPLGLLAMPSACSTTSRCGPVSTSSSCSDPPHRRPSPAGRGPPPAASGCASTPRRPCAAPRTCAAPPATFRRPAVAPCSVRALATQVRTRTAVHHDAPASTRIGWMVPPQDNHLTARAHFPVCEVVARSATRALTPFCRMP